MIRVGVAGWDYADWSGVVYPSPPPRGFDRLAFLADLFDAVEINVTFYRQPDARAAASWARRVAGRPSFRFTAKLVQDLTHAGRPSGSHGAPASVDLKAQAERFRAGIDPLLASGLLLAVLAQFPQSFHDRPENRLHLEGLATLLRGLPLVAEFRHRSWDHEGALAFLRGLGLGFCNVDQPDLPSTLRPTAHATSPVAYARLHGRNAANWFGHAASPAARYDYLYGWKEIDPWMERVRALAGRAEEVVVIANNHYGGKGPANALMIKAALGRAPVRAPASLVAAFRDLKAVALPDGRAPEQGRLFPKDGG